MCVTVEDIANLVRLQLGARRVRAGDRIVEDLRAESLDLVNILAAVEDKYGLILEETEIQEIQTVEDLYRRVRALLSP